MKFCDETNLLKLELSNDKTVYSKLVVGNINISRLITISLKKVP